MLKDEALKRGADADQIRKGAHRGLPPMSDAIFDPSLYDGEIYEADKTAYAVDAVRFAKLQESAIRDRLAALKKKWSGGVVEVKDYHLSTSGYEKTKDKAKGVVLYRIAIQNQYGGGPKWQKLEVKEGYIKVSAKPKQGADGTPVDEAKPHGAKHLEQAHHLKTLELQRAIAASKDGAAISMALTVVSLIGFEYGSVDAVKITATQRGSGQISRQMSPLYKELEETLRPFIEKRMLRSSAEGGLRERVHIRQGEHGRFFPALLDGPRSHLEKIFTLSIALETGSFICFPLRYGDDLLAVAAAERTGATLAGKWRMTEDYLKPYTRAQIDRVAMSCLAEDAEAGLPDKKGEAIAALLKHEARQADWLAPELHFGSRSIIEAEAGAMLGFTPSEPERDFDEEDDAPACRECGCTENNACVTDGEPCHWAEPDLCSACAMDAGEEAA